MLKYPKDYYDYYKKEINEVKYIRSDSIWENRKTTYLGNLLYVTSIRLQKVSQKMKIVEIKRNFV